MKVPLPAPPVRVSLPVPPISMSLPSPPLSVSFAAAGIDGVIAALAVDDIDVAIEGNRVVALAPPRCSRWQASVSAPISALVAVAARWRSRSPPRWCRSRS